MVENIGLEEVKRDIRRLVSFNFNSFDDEWWIKLLIRGIERKGDGFKLYLGSEIFRFW